MRAGRVEGHDVKKICAQLLWERWGESCKVLRTDGAAEGLEAIEMESLRRKLIYYLYDWNKHLKKKESCGQTMTSSREFKWNWQLERCCWRKTTQDCKKIFQYLA